MCSVLMQVSEIKNTCSAFIKWSVGVQTDGVNKSVLDHCRFSSEDMHRNGKVKK